MIRLALILVLLQPATAILCKAHEVAWQTEAGSDRDGTAKPGPVGQSVYFMCNTNREDRADELVRTRFAPVYDQHVADGGIVSWSWQSHDTDSEYRRLLKMTASDWNKLLTARESILGMIEKMQEAEEFSDICYSFTENLLDIENQHL